MLNLIPAQYRLMATVIAVAILSATMFYAGWSVNGWRWESNVAEEKAEAHKAELEAIAQRDIERERLAEMGREMVKKYQESLAKQKDYYRKWKNEVRKTTTGRECLSADAVGVYNSAILGEGSVPGAASRTPEASTATDTDVLENSVANYEQYSECRQQLNALIDWYEKTR